MASAHGWVKSTCRGLQGPGRSALPPPPASSHSRAKRPGLALFSHPFHRSWSFVFMTEYLTVSEILHVPGSFSLFMPKLKYIAESPFLSILSQTRVLPTHSVNYSISISSMAPIIMQLFHLYFYCLNATDNKLQRGRDCVWLVVL